MPSMLDSLRSVSNYLRKFNQTALRETIIMNKTKTIHLFLIIIVLLLLLSLIHSYHATIMITNTGGQYLLSAIELFKGKIPGFIHCRIFYPFTLAASFHIGGPTLDSAYWLTTGIFVLSILITFYFAHVLYGRWVAFGTSILLCTSIQIFLLNRQIGVDFLFPSLILLSCILFLKGCQPIRKWLFVLSGITLGMATITKETGWFYWVFPFVVFFLIEKYRTKEIAKMVLLHFICSFGILAVGIGVLLHNDQSLWELFGQMQLKHKSLNFGQQESTIPLLFNIIFNSPITVLLNLSKGFLLFPLMFIGLMAVIWLGFGRKQIPDRIFLSVLIPIIPFVIMQGVFAGINRSELRHIVLFILIMHVALVRLIQPLITAGIYYLKIINNTR